LQKHPATWKESSSKQFVFFGSDLVADELTADPIPVKMVRLDG
jgi:hypothetical protein